MGKSKNTVKVMAIEESINSYCDSIIAEEKKLYHSDLEPFSSYSSKLRNQLVNSLTSYSQSYRKGYQLVLSHVAAKKNSEEKRKFLIPGELEKTLKSPDDFYDLLEKKGVLQAVFNYSGEMMREVYETAIDLKHHKNFKESADVFVFLLTLNPYVGAFWQGLGRTFQEQGMFQEALQAYKVSINCGPYRVNGYRDAVRCCIASKDFEEALSILNYGLEAFDIAVEENDLQDFKKDLLAMKAYVEKLKKGERV